MSLLQTVNETILLFLPLTVTVIIVSAILWISHVLLIQRHQDDGNERLFPRQLAMLTLTLMGVIAIALSLPVSDSSRNQVIGLIGLVISGVFAFSSSTIFSNIMAGTMLRVTKPFRTGDFIQVGELFGRVVERGLLDTEIQTENRELVAIPNTLLVSTAVTVTRSSGCIVSTTLSLGYDVHHAQVETLLLQAAENSQLTDPFVQVLELGNFAITYKISGMLVDVKSLLSARSNLRKQVLDGLHGEGIEIMSPSFMNQRKVPDDGKVIPVGRQPIAPSHTENVAESVVFDKAEEAEQRENAKAGLQAQIAECEQRLGDAKDEQKELLQQQLKMLKDQLKILNDTPVEQAESPAQ
ncbi:mechanosensitive ion channel family protein [Rheinheimera sp. UJ51]|uniref:mechanosensitive ion channel domain-containing protein n=1 Tax=Rheinheimera sp. UJ51 TaxID=2892446 RepID=UPI001E4F575F|nr:mechanosensitive ion channel domain-containing protein [Rheinheimera sp. UJ51]MCC5451263.1 mechanosensitive ion channel family protein [Rheinheimera sp. UJ51]